MLISPVSSFAAIMRSNADTDRLTRLACFWNVLGLRSAKARLVFFEAVAKLLKPLLEATI